MSDRRKYSIVDFAPPSEGEPKWSDLVSSSWISEKEGQLFSYWPPKAVNKAKATKTRLAPTKHWQEFVVERVVVSFDDYDLARRALGRIETAERTSDIDKESPAKNSRKGRKRIFNEDIHGEHSDTELPDPPQLNQATSSSSKSQRASTPTRDVPISPVSSHSLLDYSEISTPDDSPAHSSISEASSRNYSRGDPKSPLRNLPKTNAPAYMEKSMASKRLFREPVATSEKTTGVSRNAQHEEGKAKAKKIYQSKSTHTPKKLPMKTLAASAKQRLAPKANSSNHNEEWQRNIERKLYLLQADLKDALEMLTQIHTSTCSPNASNNNTKVEYLQALLPLKTIDLVKQLNDKISRDKELKKSLVQLLAEEGGHSVADATRRCLRILFNDEVAALFTWEGASGKQRLRDLKLVSCLTDAVKRMPAMRGATNKQVEMAARMWLLHANDRLKQRKKKEDRAKESEGDREVPPLQALSDSDV